MGNCKGKLSKSEKNKFREDAYVKNIGGDKIDHGSDEPKVHSKADINIDRNEIDHGKDGPPKTDVDENKENSTHAKISTKPVNTIDHDKDRLTVHKKAKQVFFNDGLKYTHVILLAYLLYISLSVCCKIGSWFFFFVSVCICVIGSWFFFVVSSCTLFIPLVVSIITCVSSAVT
jgi:hypothetical protein